MAESHTLWYTPSWFIWVCFHQWTEDTGLDFEIRLGWPSLSGVTILKPSSKIWFTIMAGPCGSRCSCHYLQPNPRLCIMHSNRSWHQWNHPLTKSLRPCFHFVTTQFFSAAKRDLMESANRFTGYPDSVRWYCAAVKHQPCMFLPICPPHASDSDSDVLVNYCLGT